jgi:hypothetical protein
VGRRPMLRQPPSAGPIRRSGSCNPPRPSGNPQFRLHRHFRSPSENKFDTDRLHECCAARIDSL